MATVDEKIAREAVKCNGKYEEDQQIIAIWRYKNDWQGESFSLSYTLNDELNLISSAYVHDSEVLWRFGRGLTEKGRIWYEKGK